MTLCTEGPTIVDPARVSILKSISSGTALISGNFLEPQLWALSAEKNVAETCSKCSTQNFKEANYRTSKQKHAKHLISRYTLCVQRIGTY